MNAISPQQENETEAEAKRNKLRKIFKRCRDDFPFYAERALKIVTKADQHGKSKVAPFKFNAAQKYIHERIEKQKAELGYVRAIILKGRQQGASTYTEGRFYWKTTLFGGQRTYILTHKQEATDNLFAMVQRYHKYCPPYLKPTVSKSNAKEFSFSQIESKYQVATAGSKEAGRSATLENVHGSEVAFWENGETHLKGMMQALPLAKDTEAIFESTANGIGNIFYKQWMLAQSGQSDFIAIFVPWFWQQEYRREVPEGFEPEDTTPEGLDDEPTEAELKEKFGWDNQQVYWRRRKIIELGGGEDGLFAFKQEYPNTPDEAFQSSSGKSLINRRYVLKARASTVASQGDLIIGVDPAGDGENSDRTAIMRRRGRRMFDHQTFNKLNTMQIAALLHRIIKKEKPTRMFIDVGGLGVGIVDRLLELNGTHGVVVPVNFGEAALDPEVYVNRRAEMAYSLKEWLEDVGGANIPDDDEIQADFLASVPDDPDSNQRRRLKSKKWMRSQGISSPDLFDAAKLTFALPVAQGDGSIGNSKVDYDPTDNDGFASQMIGNSFTDFDV